MRLPRALAAAALTGLMTLPLSASEGEIDYRSHTMQAIGGHMQAMVDILRQKVSHSAHLTLHANAMVDLAGIAPTLFPEGSEGGEALPAIWEDPDDFAERLDAFETAAGGLQTALSSGADVGSAFQSLGQACKGCHDNYREED